MNERRDEGWQLDRWMDAVPPLAASSNQSQDYPPTITPHPSPRRPSEERTRTERVTRGFLAPNKAQEVLKEAQEAGKPRPALSRLK